MSRSLLCVFLCLLGAAATADAQSGAARTTSVMGYMWTATNRPIVDARMQLRDTLSGQVTRTTMTNSSGEFIFLPPPGAYVVEYVTAAGEILAVGNPFTLSEGETLATFVRLGAQMPILVGRGAVDLAVGAMSVWRDGSAGGAPGAGVALGIGPGRVALALDASGVRRDGHTDWRALGGVRLWLSDPSSRGFFLSGLAGVLARSSKAGLALAAGVGGEWRTSGRLGFRIQADATRDSVGGVVRNGVRGSVWLVVR